MLLLGRLISLVGLMETVLISVVDGATVGGKFRRASNLELKIIDDPGLRSSFHNMSPTINSCKNAS